MDLKAAGGRESQWPSRLDENRTMRTSYSLCFFLPCASLRCALRKFMIRGSSAKQVVQALGAFYHVGILEVHHKPPKQNKTHHTVE